jgi:hypothetical protein
MLEQIEFGMIAPELLAESIANINNAPPDVSLESPAEITPSQHLNP